MKLVKQKLDETRPDLLVLIDYQEFNQKMAAYAKGTGIKVLFYISPQVWAWRPERVHKIGKIIDHMAVIFKFEEDFYHKVGIPVTFVGNPLVGKVKTSGSITETRQQLGFNAEDKIIGLFPGSRQNEISRLLPVMLASARLLTDKHANLKFVLPVATTVDRKEIEQQCQQSGTDIKLTDENLYEVIACCDSIVSCSGTATLEIALMQVPLCIIYKTAWLTYIIMKRLVSIDCIGLANIVAGKPIVREFLQREASPENISAELERMSFDADYRRQMLSELSRIKDNLGQDNGSENVAKLALELLPKSV